MRDMQSGWRPSLLAAASMFLLQACGGGGGGGGPAPEKSVVSTGTVAGIGSVYLNGTQYDTLDAEVRVDGEVGHRSDLEPGQVVVLEGRLGGDPSARLIRLDRNLVGPVQHVWPEELQFHSLGQAVRVSAETTFGAGIVPASLLGISVGDIVLVSGFRDDEGGIRATRIDLAAAARPYQVTGRATVVDLDTHRFFVNALEVDYSQANLLDFPTGQPAAGDFVRVSGEAADASGAWPASRVEWLAEPPAAPKDKVNVIVDGVVQRFASIADFDVQGWTVAAGTASFDGGTSEDVVPGARVEVAGTWDGPAARLTASRVRLRPADLVRVISKLTDVDVDSRRVETMGVVALTDIRTRFEDRSDAEVRAFRLDDLNDGDWVDLRGYEDPASGDRMIVTRLERIEERTAHVLRGPAAALEEPDFTVMGAKVHTTAATLFLWEGGSELSAGEFFLLASGRIVEASGSYDGTTLTATYAILKLLAD